jgi:hypothetical protein
MASSLEKQKNLVERHIEALKKLKGMSVEAGWFESARYVAGAKGNGEPIPENLIGMAIAKIARIQEFGATINHPGGTKYTKDANGRVKFVSSGPHDGVTKAHTITIPARPFMRLASVNFAQKRNEVQHKIASQLIRGKINPVQAMGQIGLYMEGCIVDAIKNGAWQPNSKATERAKGFNKPLIDSAQMWQAVASKVHKGS